MKWVSVSHGQLHVDDGEAGPPAARAAGFTLDVPGWDALAPGCRFARRAVHELLHDADAPAPAYPAVVLARGASRADGDVIWVDAERTLYPPAVAAAGVDLARFHLIRPPADQVPWAVAECLRCPGVAAVVAVVPADLSRVGVRRLQLAAEAATAVGILVRELGPGSDVYAAATRWHVRPVPGGRDVQRWDVRLAHGHGGRVGESVTLERHRRPDLAGVDVDGLLLPAGGAAFTAPAAAPAAAERPAVGRRAIG